MTTLSKALQAAAGNAGEAVYVEDVFSTYLYTGNDSTQTITNGIDLAGEGGLVWIKRRLGTVENQLFDTARGVGRRLQTDTSNAEYAPATNNLLTAFNSDGFSLRESAFVNGTTNGSYASWTFRKAEKFFDVVTYTGNGSNPRTISHNLGSVPGCIIVKQTNTSDSWYVYHRSLSDNSGNPYFLKLNSTASQDTGGGAFGTPSSTTFTVRGAVNTNTYTYVAYIFAHDAGGFGEDGSENVISCGSYTGNGSSTGPVVTLGYEPQWLLIKNATDGATNWTLIDNMRGFPVGSAAARLHPNLSDAEYNNITVSSPLPTGFQIINTNSFCNTNGSTYIYIAIRRGPMKVPESGTEVFSPIAYSGANGAAQNINAGFPVDVDIIKIRNDGTRDPLNHARLMGGVFLKTDATSAQASFSDNIVSFSAGQNVIGLPATGGGTNEINGASSSNYIGWAFRRAPGFMDVVCFYATAGTAGSPTQTFNHNLGVIPELAISKTRGTANSWFVYSAALGTTKRLRLQSDGAEQATPYFTALTSSTFTIDNYNSGTPADNNVAYLFATVAGVSKVGSYTGNGSSQTINCGFAAGARFVLIKRTDSTGDWYVWDSARGIVAGNDPHLSLNTTAAEVTTDDTIDPASSGFIVNQLAATNVNVSSATYIYLAIA